MIFNNPSKLLLLFFLLVCATSCATQKWESIEYEPVGLDDYATRDVEPAIFNTSDKQLEADHYTLMGKLTVTIIHKQCDVVDGICRRNYGETNATEKFLSRARELGADGVVLEAREQANDTRGIRDGVCLQYQPHCEMVTVENPRVCRSSNFAIDFGCYALTGSHQEQRCRDECISKEEIPVTRSFTVTSGFLWRHDPEPAPKATSKAKLKTQIPSKPVDIRNPSYYNPY